MRTTLTLDDDVHRELETACRRDKRTFRAVVNEALRAGLLALEQKPGRPVEAYRTEPVSLGRPRLPDLDNIAEVLALAEGDDGP
jgi:hypothetical protein